MVWVNLAFQTADFVGVKTRREAFSEYALPFGAVLRSGSIVQETYMLRTAILSSRTTSAFSPQVRYPGLQIYS